MFPLLFVLRRCFSPAGGAGCREAGAERRPTGVPRRAEQYAKRFAAALGGDGRLVIEMDVALEILLHARERAGQDGVNARFAQGDASHLPLADGAVDGVFCNRLLHHILSADERAVWVPQKYFVLEKF